MSKINLTLNQKVSWYLMASYAYYKLNYSLLPDDTYDQICKDLLKDFDKIDHIHKHLLCKLSLECGTGYDLEYPRRVIHAAEAAIIKNEEIL